MVNILLNSFRFDEEWCYPVLKQYIKPSTRVLIFPWAFRPGQISSDAEWQKLYNRENGIFSSGLRSVLHTYGVPDHNMEWVNFFTETTENLIRKIRTSDMLYFCGGLPDVMYARLDSFGVIPELEHFDGIVAGDSAGAVIQFEEYHISPDRDYPDFRYQGGLGYLHGFDIEVHYTGTPAQNESISNVLVQKQIPVYGIEPEGAVIVDYGKVIPVGQVTTFAPNSATEQSQRFPQRG